MLRHTTAKIGGTKHHVTVADSVKELTDAVAAKTKNKDRRVAELSESFLGRFFKDIGQACDAATQPWEDGIRMVADMTSELRKTVKLPKPVSLKRQKMWSSEDGDEIDFDRLRAGEDFYRTTKKKNSVKTKQLTVFIDTCANARRKAASLLWRGIAAITIARLLEDAGYRVAIMTYASATRGFESGKGHSVIVCVKKMQDRINIGTLASAVSGWFFRSVGFESYNLIPRETPSYNLGHHNEDVGELLEMFEPNPDARLNINGVWDKDGAASLIKTVIEKLNSEAENKLAVA